MTTTTTKKREMENLVASHPSWGPPMRPRPRRRTRNRRRQQRTRRQLALLPQRRLVLVWKSQQQQHTEKLAVRLSQKRLRPSFGT